MDQEQGGADIGAEARRLTAAFFEALESLYVDAGEPALRTVAARGERLSAANLSNLLSGRRIALPQYEVLIELVKALTHDRPAPESAKLIAEWRERWKRTREAQRRADRADADRALQGASAAEDVLARARAEAQVILDEAREAAERSMAEVDERVRQAASAADVMAKAHADAASREHDSVLALLRAEAATEELLRGARMEAEGIEARLRQADEEATALRQTDREDAEAVRAGAMVDAERATLHNALTLYARSIKEQPPVDTIVTLNVMCRMANTHLAKLPQYPAPSPDAIVTSLRDLDSTLKKLRACVLKVEYAFRQPVVPIPTVADAGQAPKDLRGLPPLTPVREERALRRPEPSEE